MVDQRLLKLDHSKLKTAWKNRKLARAVASAVGVGKFLIGNHFNLHNSPARQGGARARLRLRQIGPAKRETAIYFRQSPATKGPTCRILTGQSCLERRIFKGFLYHGT
jgi:hypothetical protein